MRRREFIAVIGAAAIARPRSAAAQQLDPIRNVGLLTNCAADDAVGQARITAFLQGLQERGWTVGRNLRIDTRWGAGDAERSRKYAAELLALAPDVVLAATTPNVEALQRATQNVPIVFAGVSDPVGAGLVASLARPGGNTTGFFAVRIRHKREMAGIAQASCAQCDSRRGAAGLGRDTRDRTISGDAGRGAVVRGGIGSIGRG